ncbi:YggS family pyridoxal phosphate-dependent enzyme [Sporosarcina sp. BI001-red]|uniref:YggS family pyridoxal phosphate-dependent enzyme n=1 Tax=Sporosarcina sp. BI001-red TaxID=2282866 RepID=UPI000E26470C|nr:YggS family pyridoxal phosphate-dependent enzyme [Sporosarcina sp. BI001-red]REB09686.1 YggS family pyridoxal phosphate-dependent enzyme [Sporosarcina sp. BI001-red]
MTPLQQRINTIEESISQACERVGRDRDEVTVIAVTKQVSEVRTQNVLDQGIIHLGENRPEGLLAKQHAIPQGAVWHFIGNVQSRKVKEIIERIDYLHSLDRLSIAKEIQKRAVEPIDCFVQVNVSGEDSKSGLSPTQTQSFIESLSGYDKIRVIGLMTMAPLTEDQDEIRKVFRDLRELRDGLAAKHMQHAPLTKLSMGMSNDYSIAIEEGATHVRIGTALVGSESEGDE